MLEIRDAILTVVLMFAFEMVGFTFPCNDLYVLKKVEDLRKVHPEPDFRQALRDSNPLPAMMQMR